MRARFRWQVPQRFNIAERCCDSWAREFSDRVAIVHLDGAGARQEWSYGRLKRASDGLAASLRARGVGFGDRVAVLLAQCPEVMIAHMAAYKLGAVVLPLFTLFGPDALDYRLRDSGARALVTDGDNLDKVMALRAGLPDLAEIYCIDRAAAPVRTFWDEVETASAFQPVDTLAEDPACLIYTSGTTGDPKGVLHAHRFLIGHLPSVEAHHEGFPQPGDTGWTPADWAWIGGLMDMAMPCLHYGVPLVSHRMRRFDADAAWRLIAAEHVRNLFLPPTALKLMRQAQVPCDVAIRSVGSGGEALGADLLDWAQTALNAPINEIYGQTECNLVLASCAGSMPVVPGSMGQPVPGFDVAVIDAAGAELGDGEVGEIAVRRPNPVMFLRYWNKPAQTAERFTGDWMRTGDLGRRDERGYFWYVSRDDDVITSSGYRIGPVEIENCLTGHPDVVMAAVIGVPDATRGEAVKAFVVLRDGAGWDGLEAALIARVKARVSPHLAPRTVERIAALPMTATGKIMRRSLRDSGVS
ncbi:MAG: AMP-binding protein [Rhodobacter sp.]|nr:AMP-binding protein [Rhodobacter sp.]